MAATQVRTGQIGDGSVSRADLNTTVSGQAVIAKAVQGTAMTLSSTGQDAGTGDVTISLNVNSDLNLQAGQTVTVLNTNTGTDDTALRLKHNMSSPVLPAAGCGTTIWFSCQSNNVADRDQGQIFTAWSVATDASRASYMGFRTVSATSMGEKARLWGSGAFHVGGTGIGTDPGADGVINANTGFRQGNAAAAGALLRGTGTNFTGQAVTFTHVSPAAVTSLSTTTTAIMCGLGATSPVFTITPKYSGNVLVLVSGRFTPAAAGAYVSLRLAYGSGTAPAKGAASAGTAVGNTAFSPNVAAAATQASFTCQAIITGLTVNTTYWIDMAISSSASTTSTADNMDAIAIEL